MSIDFENIEISDDSAKAFGDAAGAIAGLLATGTPLAPLAPIIGLLITGGLKLTNAGYKVQGLAALRKKVAGVEALPDLTVE